MPMDKRDNSLVLFPAMKQRNIIPDFFVYGEPSRSLGVDFIHVETVMERKSLHFGKVAAHRHAHMAQIIFWYQGGGTYLCEDREIAFSAPAIGFMPSGAVHGFSVGEDADAIVISIADGGIKSISGPMGLPPKQAVFLIGDATRLSWRHMDQLCHIMLEDYRAGEAESIHILTGLANTILAHIQRLDQNRPSHPTGSTMLGLDLRRMIEEHFRDNWAVPDYVDALATTPHLLDKAARETFGKPVKKLILERKLAEAKRLLLFTIRPVEDIGREVGFDDPAYFSRFFRRMTGEAPAAWRQRELVLRQASST